VRNAIKKHQKMQFQIRRINVWITAIRKSVELTKILQMQNADRDWIMRQDGVPRF
jgi:hypothetical protein